MIEVVMGSDIEVKTSDEELLKEMKKLNTLLERLYGRQTLLQSFLSGIITSLGTFVGATVVVGVMVYLLSKIQLLPILGNWFADLITEILRFLPKRNLFF